MDDGAYEAEDKCDDGDKRDDCAKFGPVDRGLVGDRNWCVCGQLFGQGSGLKATV